MEIIIQDFNSFDQKDNGVKVFEEIKGGLENIKESPANNSTTFRNQFKNAISIKGYPHNIIISPKHSITITSSRENVGICLPLGYIARAFYDLMKLNYYSTINNGFCGILICPIKPNGNRAYFSRVAAETENMYSNFIKMPLRIVGIDQ